MEVEGPKLYYFVTRLRRVKHRLVSWNKKHFKDLFHTIKIIEE